MVKRTQIIVVDDLDGMEIESGAKTVTFAHGGHAYEIDLNETNAQRLDEALAPFVAAGRRVEARRSPGTPDKPDLPAVRSWARAHGIKVSERGRVSRGVQDAYDAAH